MRWRRSNGQLQTLAPTCPRCLALATRPGLHRAAVPGTVSWSGGPKGCRSAPWYDPLHDPTDNSLGVSVNRATNPRAGRDWRSLELIVRQPAGVALHRLVQPCGYPGDVGLYDEVAPPMVTVTPCQKAET
jgi:hypothetical protein